MKKIRGAIFDADGTILDSLEKWEHIAGDFLHKMGINDDVGIDDAVKELSFSEGAALIQEKFLPGMSSGDIQTGISDMIADFYRNDVSLIKGAKEFILDLQKDNVKMCIATSGDKKLIIAALKRLGLYECFVGIYSCDEIGSGKDRPDIYEFALKKLGLNKSDIIVFEDSVSAANTAGSAGFDVVMVDECGYKIKRSTM